MRILLLPLMLAGGAWAGDQVVLSRDGWFRLKSGETFMPLGGFHGNVLPVARLNLSAEESARVEPHIWEAQKTDGQGHVDLWDASDEMLRRWFRMLAADGVTAIRLFARARVGSDVLDLCGKLNPELKQVFHRTFAAARPHGIRFLLQILPEPGSMCYVRRDSIEKRALPRYSREELEKLTPAQRRFLVEKRLVKPPRRLFTDRDVLACQKLYLEEALEWVAAEPQIFALEIYNEQGWSSAGLEGKYQHVFTFPWEGDEIRWTAEIVRTIRKRLPKMLVTLSHPGFGVTGYDPLKWSRAAGADFYSSHMYAGLSGENREIDFAAASAATGLIIRAGVVNFKGEWGVFDSPVPEEVKRFSHRDAIWLSLLGREPGFLQWTYEFPEEYRWPAKVIGALPKGFSPARPEVQIEIGEAYRAFHTDSRYRGFVPGQLFPAFPFNAEKQADANLQKMFAAYKRSLEIGVPVAFTMGGRGAMSLEEFAALDPAKLKRPLQATGGYQLTWLKDAKSPLWIGYLRRRKIQGFGTKRIHYVGVPEEGELAIKLDLPAGRYRVRLISLGADRLESRVAAARETIPVAEKTSDDYVVVITRESVRLGLE